MKDGFHQKMLLAIIVWTFYEQSHAVGMGFLQAVPAAKARELIIKHVSLIEDSNGVLTFNTDYLFGRMMKTTLRVSDNGTIEVSHSDNPEYCSWLRLRQTPSERRKALVSAALEAAIEAGIDEEFLNPYINRNF